MGCNMTDKHVLYGAEFSLYSGKARSYLRYKRIPFDEVLSSLKVYKKIIIPNTGVRFIPVVRTPSGEYLQDTSNIIDTLETVFAERPVMPATSRQRLASLLLEVYGDEWLLRPAMHYRWNHDNQPFIYDEFGRSLFPGWAGFIRRVMGKRIAARFSGLLPRLGISDANRDAIEDWFERDFLPVLDDHFANHDFLFGGHPTIGDFGLIGPMYAHLYRDAVSRFALRTDFPVLSEWVERTNGEGALNARMYGQKLYSLDDDGELIQRVATSDGGEWLEDVMPTSGTSWTNVPSGLPGSRPMSWNWLTR